MDVILVRPIEQLGRVGEVVKVRDGYARNFLLPTGAALEATPANRQRMERERARREEVAARAQADAQAMADRLQALACTVRVAVGEEGQLYGSVTAAEIATACTEAGVPVHKRDVRLAAPIRALGEFTVEVHLYPGVAARLKVSVVKR